MSYVIIGLGNPGVKYENTRHNAGRIIVQIFAGKNESDGFSFNKRLNADTAKIIIGGKKTITVLLPDTYMNKSGSSIKPLITSAKKASKLIVVHDDLDIPIGKYKLSFGKNSGGNKGVESIIRSIKTKNFIRVRIGIAPITTSGKIKKPKGEKAVEKFILGNFTSSEMSKIKSLSDNIGNIIVSIVLNGYEKAVSMKKNP